LVPINSRTIVRLTASVPHLHSPSKIRRAVQSIATTLVSAARAAGCKAANGDHMVEAAQEMMLDFFLGTSVTQGESSWASRPEG
jgi:hypothetical protein